MGISSNQEMLALREFGNQVSFQFYSLLVFLPALLVLLGRVYSNNVPFKLICQNPPAYFQIPYGGCAFP